MAFDETFDITNPAQLAQPFAIDIQNAAGYYDAELTSFEEEIEGKINQAVGYLGLRGTYLVEAGLAWVMQPCRLTKKFKKNIASTLLSAFTNLPPRSGKIRCRDYDPPAFPIA